MKILYLESVAGIAGDMFAASFLHAGLVTLEELQNLTEKLGLVDVKLIVTDTKCSDIQAYHLEVQFDNHTSPALNHAHVHANELIQLVTDSLLTPSVKDLACNILDCLATAEAQCHGVDNADVAFHEIGMTDSLMDIVMAAYCITKVAPDKVIASPVKLGRGHIETSHGTLPVPPPVSAVLAMGMTITALPPSIQEQNIELSTPTGLAILKALQPEFSSTWPEGNVLFQGLGAGAMRLSHYPNVFRIALLETTSESQSPVLQRYHHDTMIEMHVNIDDASPEQLAWISEKLFVYGAVDVWQTPATGKKGRVMIVISALVDLTHWGRCADFILKETSTFGLRYYQVERLKLDRHFETRTHALGVYQVKIGSDKQGHKLKEKVEFEDMRKIWDKRLEL